MRDPGGLSVDADGSGADESVNAKLRVVSELPCDDGIDASASEVVGDKEANFWWG